MPYKFVADIIHIKKLLADFFQQEQTYSSEVHCWRKTTILRF